jgi:hypothetical protein
LQYPYWLHIVVSRTEPGLRTTIFFMLVGLRFVFIDFHLLSASSVVSAFLSVPLGGPADANSRHKKERRLVFKCG